MKGTGRLKPEDITNPLKYLQWLNDDMKEIQERRKRGLPIFDIPDFRALSGGDVHKAILLRAQWARLDPPFDKASSYKLLKSASGEPRRRRRFPVMVTLSPETIDWLDLASEGMQLSRSFIVERILKLYIEKYEEERLGPAKTGVLKLGIRKREPDSRKKSGKPRMSIFLSPEEMDERDKREAGLNQWMNEQEQKRIDRENEKLRRIDEEREQEYQERRRVAREDGEDPDEVDVPTREEIVKRAELRKRVAANAANASSRTRR